MGETFYAKKYLSYFCVALFRVVFPCDEGGFVAMEAAVARISNRRQGRGRSRWECLSCNFLAELIGSGARWIIKGGGGMPLLWGQC